MHAATISASKCIAPNSFSFNAINKARATSVAGRPNRKTVVAAASGKNGEKVMTIEEMAKPMTSKASLCETATVQTSVTAAQMAIRPQPIYFQPFVPAAAGVTTIGMGVKVLMDIANGTPRCPEQGSIYLQRMP